MQSSSRSDRFKVVKIESTEPFKRGRWKCMDFLDQSYGKIFQQNSIARPNDYQSLPPSPSPTESQSSRNGINNIDTQSSMLQIFYRQNSVSEPTNECTCFTYCAMGLTELSEAKRNANCYHNAKQPKYQYHVLMPGMVSSSLKGVKLPMELNFIVDEIVHLAISCQRNNGILSPLQIEEILSRRDCYCKSQMKMETESLTAVQNLPDNLTEILINTSQSQLSQNIVQSPQEELFKPSQTDVNIPTINNNYQYNNTVIGTTNNVNNYCILQPCMNEQIIPSNLESPLLSKFPFSDSQSIQQTLHTSTNSSLLNLSNNITLQLAADSNIQMCQETFQQPVVTAPFPQMQVQVTTSCNPTYTSVKKESEVTISSSPVDEKVGCIMDLVKMHLKLAVLEDVNQLKLQIAILTERVAQLEHENDMLRQFHDLPKK